MVTSRSNDASWRASALIFSGRANPEWTLSDANVERLIALWSSLAIDVASAPISALGYRGCALSDGTRRWRAFDGAATLSDGAQVETRRDAERAFERAILATAPRGTLPDAVSF